MDHPYYTVFRLECQESSSLIHSVCAVFSISSTVFVGVVMVEIGILTKKQFHIRCKNMQYFLLTPNEQSVILIAVLMEGFPSGTGENTMHCTVFAYTYYYYYSSK